MGETREAEESQRRLTDDETVEYMLRNLTVHLRSLKAERDSLRSELNTRVMPDVGDGPCMRCGGNNPAVWFVSPKERWVEVVGSPAGLLCPNCFFALVQERGQDDGTRCWAIFDESEKELAWQERWEHGRSVGREESAAELSTVREALAWALDLLDMYDDRLVKLGDPEELVYSPIHKAGKAKARAALI